MGRRGGGKRGGDRWRGGKGPRTQPPRRADYEEPVKTNAQFEQYYNQLGILEDVEKEDFWSTLRRELPNSFRFTGSKRHAVSVQKILKERYIPEIESIEHNRAAVEAPTSIPWFPHQLAWQMTTPKHVVRKFAPFKSFQQFLVSETSAGNISRQEIVSMIPPLLMDIRSGMVVLDLCAAPGSKTAQLIEMVHGGEESRIQKVIRDSKLHDQRGVSPDGKANNGQIEEKEHGEWTDQGRSTGLVVANDVDYKRAHMLIHQTKRLNSPNLLVTNHDATMYPSIKLPSENRSDRKPVQNRYLKFDRVLADVPCSGDGTARKNANVWKDWIPGNAIGLFPTQVRILVRALQMTKAGGRVVYSTCSMNPVEDEAVVAAAIERCGGPAKVNIVDCADQLPGLERKPGLKAWNVMDRLGSIHDSWAQVQDDPGRLVEGMFPPEESLPLDRCIRVYPHLQNTGGFFIAVLEKKGEIRAKPESESQRIEPKTSIVSAADKIRAQPTNGSLTATKIDALDKIAPPQASEDAENLTTAARQNQEIAPNVEPLSARKHELEDQADTYMSTKRIKVRDEVDDAAPRGGEDREVHWPPPPGAQLDVSRPETAALPEPDPVEKETVTASNKPLKPTAADYKGKRNSGQQPFEEPFKYLATDHPELQTIYDFYDLNPHFPRDRFMVRNATGHPVKAIYYTTGLARDILTTNEATGLKFVHCGIKMFVKQDVQRENTCRWRIQTDGLQVIEAWVGEERVVRLWKKSTLKTLLIEMFPKVTGDGWKELGEIGERVRDIDLGCCILRVEKGSGEDAFSESFVLPLWRSLHSLNLMLPKEDRKAMLLRLYNEIIPLQDGSKARLDREKNGATANAQNTASLGVDGEKDDAPDRGIDLQAILDATSEEEVIPVTDDET
ncbi:MAG: hypothetical protein L6R36_004492 [Xanthoria steineri]|nr:MAG: hypothetical protein L6R36_004492 [Xanthoria steineri]